jgi:hypothetical protein
VAHATRIMYIENKGGQVVDTPFGAHSSGEANLTGPARIGRVTFSKTGRSLIYGGRSFSKATGFKANYCADNGEWFWISGPKKRGGDSLYATNIATEIDEDVREEYWTKIRNQPERRSESRTL